MYHFPPETGIKFYNIQYSNLIDQNNFMINTYTLTTIHQVFDIKVAVACEARGNRSSVWNVCLLPSFFYWTLLVLPS